MVKTYSTFLGIKLSAFGRVLNTNAVLSLKREYEREEDKKVHSYHAKESGTEELAEKVYREGYIEEARYEMVEDKAEKLKENQWALSESNRHHQSKPDLTDNKYLNHYILNQENSYHYRGLNLDYQV